MKYTILIALIFLSACAGSPVSIAASSDEALKTKENTDLAAAYWVYGEERVLKELERRKDIRPKYANAVKLQRPEIGMNIIEIMAIYGKPYNVNRTETAGREVSQFVFRGGNPRGGPPINAFIYFEDGFVRTIQN
jgi:hypothetical protein